MTDNLLYSLCKHCKECTHRWRQRRRQRRRERGRNGKIDASIIPAHNLRATNALTYRSSERNVDVPMEAIEAASLGHYLIRTLQTYNSMYYKYRCELFTMKKKISMMQSYSSQCVFFFLYDPHFSC